MKPVEQDEMFPESASSSTWETDEITSEVVGQIEVNAVERGVHVDFYNKFDDLFDDDDLE